MVSKRYAYLLLGVATLFFAACGGDAWKDLTKVGNTWEFQGEVTKTKVTAKVVGTLKLGDKVFAEVAPNCEQSTNLTELCSWNEKTKEFFYVGQSSRFNDKTRQFFIAEQLIGTINGDGKKAITNADATILRYLGEEKVKVPAGEYDTFKFSRDNVRRKIAEVYWYADKVGLVRVKTSGETYGLVKYTEGKELDPKALGGENAEKGIAFIRDFFKTAQKGDIIAVKSLFSKLEGQNDFANQAPEITMLVDRIKTGVRADQATFSFIDDKSYGLRFLKFDESGTEPNVWRVDAVMELVSEGDALKIKKISIVSEKMFK